jgi:glycosyltransferase involved in cell wall biosynthesis
MDQTMAAPLRIAFSLDNMQAGGTELNAVRVAERLDRRRFDLQVISPHPDGPLKARFEAAGVPVRPFPFRSRYAPSPFGCALRLARFIRRERIDIFHAHDIYSNVFAAPWARLAGARVVASRRWWEGLPGVRWQTASRVAYRFADVVLANSPAVATLLERQDGVGRQRIAVVPNFVDEAAFTPLPADVLARLRDELRLQEGGSVVGIVANLLPVKDHATLLRAAAYLRGWRRDVKFVLVGDGPCRPALERLAGELGIGDAVVFAGKRPSLPNLHHLFDVSVLCSTSEGLPNSLLEAMAAARPVVATRVGAVADAVVDGETGELVPPADAMALAASLRRLLTDRGRARRFGEAGAKRARAEYSPAAALGALEALYLRLAGQRRLPSGHAAPVEAPAAAAEGIADRRHVYRAS